MPTTTPPNHEKITETHRSRVEKDVRVDKEGLPPVPLLAFRLRAVVLALGEAVQPPWWKSEFMNETGLRFLERLYPRSFFHAAVQAAGKGACDIHDRAVGRIGVFHLFRLPESIECEIHQIPPTSDEGFADRLRSCLSNTGELIKILLPLCGPVPDDQDAAPGARRVGSDKDLTKPNAFKKMAAAYHQAFSQGKVAFPYFAAEIIGHRG